MKKWLLLSTVAVLVIAGVVWGVSRMVREENAIPVSGQVKTPTYTVLLDGGQSSVERLQQQLQDPDLDPAARESLMEKIDLAKQAEAQQQVGANAPAPKDPPSFAEEPVLNIAPMIETGIFNGSEGMIRPSEAKINNYWQGILDNQIVMVFAGAAADDKQQGLVIVVTQSTDTRAGDIRFTTLPAPDKGGELRVVVEKNGVLTLEQPDGTQLMFDIRAQAFVP